MTFNIYFYSNEGDRYGLYDFAQGLGKFLGESSGEILEDTVGPPVSDEKISADDLVKSILKANVDDEEEFVIEITKKKGEQAYVVIKDLENTEVSDVNPILERAKSYYMDKLNSGEMVSTHLHSLLESSSLRVGVNDLTEETLDLIRKIAAEEATKLNKGE